MRISVAKFSGSEELLTIEIAADLSLGDLKAVIESESDFDIKANEMNLYYDGKLLNDDNQTLEQINIKDYDVVTCQKKPSADDTIPRPTTGLPSSHLQGIQQFFERLRSADPRELEQIRATDPQLVDALERNDFNAFIQHMMRGATQRRNAPTPTEVDLFDPRIQQRIEEVINMQNVMDNMEHAYEHAPEFFGNVVMLYINCKVNGHPIKAFVDSGAQMTIMSKACAERCGIMRLVDTRFSGIARGVGTQRILGRVHIAQLEVEKQFFATSLSVLEDQTMDMLIGLDMLRRHRCCIDLDKNVLRFENSVETSFLHESELPLHARLTGNTPDPNDTTNYSEAFLRSAAESGDTRRQQPSNQPRSPGATSASSAAAASSPVTPSPFPEKDIKAITKKGFTREQAIEELKATNGDVTKALVTLMAKSLSKPKPKK